MGRRTDLLAAVCLSLGSANDPTVEIDRPAGTEDHGRAHTYTASPSAT